MSKLSRKEVEEWLAIREAMTGHGWTDYNVIRLCRALLQAWDVLEMLKYRGVLHCIVDPPCGNCIRCNARNALPREE